MWGCHAPGPTRLSRPVWYCSPLWAPPRGDARGKGTLAVVHSASRVAAPAGQASPRAGPSLAHGSREDRGSYSPLSPGVSSWIARPVPQDTLE